ncbi:MAG: hypothetical protein P8Q14_08855 [Vicingaceae bacterium]|nr:hypothetical protein [Vicingaceae bacterium]
MIKSFIKYYFPLLFALLVFSFVSCKKSGQPVPRSGEGVFSPFDSQEVAFDEDGGDKDGGDKDGGDIVGGDDNEDDDVIVGGDNDGGDSGSDLGGGKGYDDGGDNGGNSFQPVVKAG